MDKFIRPDAISPTTNIITSDALKALVWLGFDEQSTTEDFVAAGYILLQEPTPVEQPENTVLVATKGQDNTWSATWMAADDYESISLSRRVEQSVRAARGQLLKDSDWTQGKDIPNNISSAWAPYRQALRDITTQEGFPLSVTWPTKPQ